MSPDGSAPRFDELYGLELLDAGPDEVRARVPVTTAIMQPLGLVHGGVYAAIAEAMASIGTRLGVQEDGNVAVGMNNNTTFLRPISEGTVHAHAVPIHRGRTTWVWDVDITDDEGRRAAMSRMTIAVRPAPKR